MDAFVSKVRSFRNKLQKQKCLELGVPYIPISNDKINLIDENNHTLIMEQLDKIGFVSNVRYENGRKVVGY